MGAGKSALHQKYKIKEVIGRGHFSIVKRCIDRKTGENLALKCINKSKLKEKDHRWLASEIEILTAVSHTNICRLVEVFHTQKMCYLVLELLQGGDLLERVADDHTFSDSDAADVIRTVAGVLEYLHRMGIIHRDLKPQNLVYRSEAKGAQLVVTDFGLSKFLKGGATHTKTACGTPLYLAPEVIMGNGYGKECDLWSLGVMLYVLLTGYYPFYSSDRRRLYSKITRCSYKWPDNGTYIDENAKDLVAKLLVVDIKKRMTAAEVLKHPWLSLPRTNVGEGKARNNIRKMRAKEKLRKTVNYLIDINRFMSVFALLPEGVQQRCSGRIYHRKQNPEMAKRLGVALSHMATALVDPTRTYSLVYRMKGGGYWLVASDEDKEPLLAHAHKYFTAEERYYIFSGPKPSGARFLSNGEFEALAVQDEALDKTSPVRPPWNGAEMKTAEKLSVETPKGAGLKSNGTSETTQPQPPKATAPAKELSELEANAMVKVTAKLIASKLFSPPSSKKVHFDFSKALEIDIDEQDEEDAKEATKKGEEDGETGAMTPRTLAALHSQVVKAQQRLEEAKEKANLKHVPKRSKKQSARELTIAEEAFRIAKSLHVEALKRIEEQNAAKDAAKKDEDDDKKTTEIVNGAGA
uniref:Protein kinase domain-containing protein n=1 Tax=Lotharella globosa TaxID=91324 RepID=A0A7S3YG25_9EUKA|mmetsp:Transcript_20049/g.38691  ORF Transcript_20049/g.38691 Transcript_20049/m.38691 type:complete len:636 (+) Transcript_20049:110-2017(+)